MRMTSRLLPLALLIACATPAHAVVTPIGNLHCNFSNGIPLQIGEQVTVQGTVTVPHGLFSPINIDCHIQDQTGGVDVFIGSGVGTFSFALGDSVEVTGYIRHFNGLVEIDSTGLITVTQLGAASVQPDPVVLTCQQMATSYQSNCETNESRLVRINGVHVSGGAWPTTVSTANTTLTIQDATGTTTVFIDRDTPVNGSPNPGGRFDIIGVLRQFDSSSPYTTGYQLVPRFVSDVIPECPGPLFASNPEATALDSLSATISWETQAPGTSFINYGTTTVYTDRVGDATPTTTHQVTLTGLQPRTLYHYQAESGDVNGTCLSLDRGLVTFPSPGTPGEIEVYFNQTVDQSYSSGPLAQGYVDLHAKMIPLIDSAKVSIDCTFYSFNLSDVADHLIDAHNRGVLIRLITDAGNSQTQANRLGTAGVPHITSTYGGQNHGQAAGFGIMHDKYMIVDAQSPNKDDAILWTGSWNVSSESQAEANNAIILHDYGLAAAYTLDFDQMWGSSTPTPNATNSKMGSRKSEIMPHRFMVGGVRVEAYQSPSDQPENHMIQYIQQAQHSQQFCIFDFTSDPLSHAMKVHRDSIPDFIVRGNFEGSQISGASEWCKLNGEVSCPDYWNPRGDVTQNTSLFFTLLHHKYQILDEGYPEATVWTGSHNWSAAAKTNNDENTVVVHDPNIANLYFQEFAARFLESGGAIVSVEPGRGALGIDLSASRPNPALGEASFDYRIGSAAHVNLSLYDIAGRYVRTLVDGHIPAGTHRVSWDGQNQAGQAEKSGVYFYRLRTDTGSLTRRLVLAR